MALVLLSLAAEPTPAAAAAPAGLIPASLHSRLRRDANEHPHDVMPRR